MSFWSATQQQSETPVTAVALLGWGVLRGSANASHIVHVNTFAHSKSCIAHQDRSQRFVQFCTLLCYIRQEE